MLYWNHLFSKDKKMKYFIWSLLVLCVISCNTDDNEVDCSNVLCAGRPTIVLEVFDEDTSEQFFLDVTDQAPEGLVITTDNGFELEFGLSYDILEGRLSVFQIPDSFTIRLENEFETTISSNVVVIDTDGCCDTYAVEEVSTSEGELFPVIDDILFFNLTI